MTAPIYATPDDVASRWRALTAAEYALADVLVEDASRKVRRRFATVDARIAAGTLDPDDVRMVVALMVKRAMLNSAVEGVTQMSDTGGPYSQSVAYANPQANLYFTAEDINMLAAAGTRTVRSQKLTTVNL